MKHEPPTMYLRQAGLTRNPTFSYLYCVRCNVVRQHFAPKKSCFLFKKHLYLTEFEITDG